MPKKKPNRFIAIALAFAAAAGLVLAAFGPRWLTEPDHSGSGIGLTSYETTSGARARSGSVFDLIDEIELEIMKVQKANERLPPAQQMAVPKKPWHGFPVVGLITFITSLLAAGGLAVGAGLALARKRPEVPIMPTTVAVMGLFLAIVNGCIFVATKPAAINDMEVGWSFLTFGGAIVVGLAAVFPLNKQIRPIDHELGEGSATMSWSSDLNNL
jgi:hypothetical protein